MSNVFSLSFYERMRDIVPPDFEPLLPEKPEPKFKYILEKSGKIPSCVLFRHNLQNIKFFQYYPASFYQTRY